MKLIKLAVMPAIVLSTGVYASHNNDHVDTSTGTNLSKNIYDKYWDATDATEEEINKRIAYLVRSANPRTSEERMEDLEIRERYKDAIVIDALATGAINFPKGLSVEEYHNLVDFSQSYGYTMLSTTVSNGTDKSFDETKQRMIDTKAEWVKGGYIPVNSVDDIYKAKVEGKIALDFHFQGAAQLDNFAQLAELKEIGLQRVNFSYNTNNKYGAGMMANQEPATDEGLTDLGVELLKEMNKLGIVVDCSHSSDQTCIDAAKVSTKPVILSHTNPRALMDINRNARDEAIIAVADTGGVACTNFIGGFINEDMVAQPEDIAKAVDYVGELVGRQATCVGVDYLHNYEDALNWVVRTPEKFPPADGYGAVSEIGVPADIWGVARVLEDKYSWTEKEVRGFLGENLVRVYRDTWSN